MAQQQQRVQVLLRPAKHTLVRELFSFRGDSRPLLTAPSSPPFRLWKVAKYYSNTASRTAAAARRRPLCVHIPRRASRIHKPGASRLGSSLDCDSNWPSDYIQFLKRSGGSPSCALSCCPFHGSSLTATHGSAGPDSRFAPAPALTEQRSEPQHTSIGTHGPASSSSRSRSSRITNENTERNLELGGTEHGSPDDAAAG